jgi:Tol biopolymer transport system component/dienelactone hydrolase
MGANTMIDIERLLRAPFVDIEGGFDLSPDGRYLAFSWNLTGRWEIYELYPNASDEPWLVSTGPGGKFAPKYSPDGSRLAYAVDFDGGENFHIFVQKCQAEPFDFFQGALREASPSQQNEILRFDQDDMPIDLTPDIDFAIQPHFCWSPDGSQIACLADGSGCFDTYVMPSSGGEAQLLFANGFPASNVTWSPDGCHLAVMCEATGQDYNVYIIPLDGGDPFPIGAANGPINAHNPAWSPDSTKLAFHSDVRNGFHQISIFDIGSRQLSWLTDGKANCRAPSWSPDGTQLTYISAQGATDKVILHPLAAEARAFQVEAGVHYKPHFTPDGERVILIFNSPWRPPDLWMLAPESGEFCQLTSSLPADLYDAAFRMPEEVTYPGLDGTPVPALLFKAKSAKNITPTVIVIHGGPGWHFQVEWYPFMIHLASRDWTVLAPNYRGSTGYGRDWQLSNRFDLGGVDTDDVAAGVRYLLDKSIADPKRIAVTGRSHGGYLTMSCLTRYPELWCTGSAVVPFLNWFSAHENSREDLQHWDLQNFGNPEENRDLWYERSPFFFLDQVNAPVQLICGENDPRCPASESTQARDRLLELGKKVDFHLYLGEGHAFLKTENVVDAEVQRVEFLAKALE